MKEGAKCENICSLADKNKIAKKAYTVKKLIVKKYG